MAVDRDQPRRPRRLKRVPLDRQKSRKSAIVSGDTHPVALSESPSPAERIAPTSRALATRAPEVDLRVTTNRYGGIKRHSLRERMEQVDRLDADPMDLLPEAQLMRALILDYVEDYDRMKEALLEWHAYRSGEGEVRQPPAKIPELKDVQGLIDGVGKLISRQHQIRQTGTITLAVFRRATELMAQVVSTYVADPDILMKIENAWGHIALDPKGKARHTDDDAIDAEIVGGD